MSILSRSTFFAFLVLVYLLYTMGIAVAAKQVGDFEVIVYLGPNFVGKSMAWRLEPDMRQRLVQNTVRDWRKHDANPSALPGTFGEGLIKSMKVGSQIGVYVFEHPDFCSTSTDLRSGRFKFAPGLHETLGIWEGKIVSMILYRIKDRQPLGALLMANTVEVTMSKEYAWVNPVKEKRVRLPERIQFLPAEQRGKDLQRIYRNLGNFMGDRAVSIQMYGKDVKIDLYRKSDLKGQHLVLPGQGSQETRFQLSTFKFQNDVSSARVFLEPRMSDQSRSSAPSNVTREAPPAGSAPSKVVKEAPPASREQGGKVIPFKVRIDSPPVSSDPGQPGGKREAAKTTGLPIVIDGSWKRSAGGVADVSQDGEQFTWRADNVTGIGRIDGSNVNVTWYGPKGEENEAGKITQVSPDNRAVQIDWDNGRSWTREVEPSGVENDYCRQYADRALQQISERIKRTGSVPDNDPVWKEDFDHHYNWCLQVPEFIADAGSKLRQDWLDNH